MEFWLSWQNNKERLRLPILPPSFQVEVDNLNTTININELGNIKLIGKSGLKKIAIESFFPAQEYHFCEYMGFPLPYSCLGMIEGWRKSGKPIRLIVTDTPINLAMAIENFVYGEHDGSGDVYYTLELEEYVFTEVKQDSKSHGYTVNNIRPAKEMPKTYVPKPNDTPVTIAKKTTGNSVNAKKIIERNPTVFKNNTVIKPEAGNTASAILQLYNTPKPKTKPRRGQIE